MGIRPLTLAVLVSNSTSWITVTAVTSAFVLHNDDAVTIDPKLQNPIHSLLGESQNSLSLEFNLMYSTSNNHYLFFNSVNSFLLLKSLDVQLWNKFSLFWFRHNWYMYLKCHSMCIPICRKLSIFVSKPFLFFFLLSPFSLWMVWMWLTVSLKICLFSFRLLCIDWYHRGTGQL